MNKNSYRQETTPTLFIEANGINFAYKRFGTASEVPLIFFQHFIGNMDDWDPAITNEIAKSRTVILFNNTGVASTSGKTPDNVAQMAEDAVAFIKAMDISKADFLGYSLGGFIAQQIAITSPGLIRKLILAGTAPQGSYSSFLDFVEKMKTKEGPELFLFTFFTTSEKSRSGGMQSLQRIYAPVNRTDQAVSDQTMKAQANALQTWGTMQPSFKLSGITHQVLVVNGSNDAMLLTDNSFKLFQEIPGALLSLYPDSAHGFLFQYPELFVEQCNYFLNNDL